MEIKVIQELVKEDTKIDISTIRRKREIVEARALYYKLCREYTYKSLTEIGKSVNRDHATVLWGLKHFDSWANQNVTLRSSYVNIKCKIETLKEEALNNISKEETFIDKWAKLKNANELLVNTNKELVRQLKESNTKLKSRDKFFRDNGYVIG